MANLNQLVKRVEHEARDKFYAMPREQKQAHIDQACINHYQSEVQLRREFAELNASLPSGDPPFDFLLDHKTALLAAMRKQGSKRR